MLPLAQRLANGRCTVGTWITLADVAVTEIAARSGLEWVAVDLEHTSLSDAHFEAHARVADLLGVPCLARIPSVDSHRIKRLMDSGAKGLIIANVTERAQLDAAMKAMHYPPRGERGVGLARAQRYGTGFAEYVRQSNDALLVAQIEHKEALGNLSDILSHPALDAWMIGPYDLSASLGYPGDFTHPDVTQAMDKIRAVGSNYRASAGIHVVEPDLNQIKIRHDQGFRFIAYTVDFRVLDVNLRAGAKMAATIESNMDDLPAKDTNR